MSKILQEKLPGLLLLEGRTFSDHRGFLEKPLWNSVLPDFRADEAYFIQSKKNVIRGMHFQLPPHAQGKFLYVATGKILDVVLDLRKDSETYGQFASFYLEAGSAQALFVPPGMAHGYLTLEENSLIHYVQSGHYAPEFERGVRYDSFGFDWKVSDPVLSEKDRSLPAFSDLKELL